MPSWIGLMLDVLVLAALAASAVYAFRLSRQIQQMRDDKKDFEKLIAQFSQSISRAEQTISAVRLTAQEVGEPLQEQIFKARGLFDELEMMNEVGNNLAERLYVLAEKARKAAPVASATETPVVRKEPPAVPASTPAGKTDKPLSRAEKELMDAMKSRQSGEKT